MLVVCPTFRERGERKERGSDEKQRRRNRKIENRIEQKRLREKLRDDKEDINITNRGKCIKLNMSTDTAIKRLLEKERRKERWTEAIPNFHHDHHH